MYADAEDDCVVIEDNTNYRSISCKNIPELFLDKLTAKKHFNKFGKIHKFVLRPKRQSCTVEYEREEEAENAYQNAGVFNGQHFDVEYTVEDDTQAQNTEEWVDADVQAELDAMGTGFGSTMMRAPAMKPQPAHVPILQSSRISRPAVVPRSKPLDAPIAPKIDYAVKNELEAILRRPAGNDEDKYRILDARDKLIRLLTIKQTDIKTAVSTKGTCPDMCPEKERLMRESQHQVAFFETEEGMRTVMNHKNAIKQYSRSSADQEVPLTHELRSESILKMTMTYLLHRIMDLCDDEDVNVGDWFHFVWDRTRSIRKDITQQELCSLSAVELVEQCARFHIHCAARLIAEDPSVFDQKINTENLTKCLQTLKYMYHDLRLKNISCPREAEFRAYVILLNLNDCNFLWEVKQLPEAMQQSPLIKEAIEFYLAMESNNYVKFFKLIQKTTYMNACILMRYFTQIRIKALKIMMKAYHGRHAVSVPIEYMTNVLGFESVEAALSMFGYYGLECDGERVALDKNAFYMPDSPYLMDRCMEVEMKRIGSVGESVCGRPLDPASIFENHVPHNSFDDDGYLREESWTAEDQLRGENAPKRRERPPPRPVESVFKIPTVSPMQRQQPTQPSASIFGNGNSAGDSIFKKALNETPPQMFRRPASEVTPPTGNIFGNAAKATASIFGSVKVDAGAFKDDSVFKHFDAKPRADLLFDKANTTPQQFSFVKHVALSTPPHVQGHAPKRDFDAELKETQRKLEIERAKKVAVEEELKRKRLEAEKVKLLKMKEETDERKRQEELRLRVQKAEEEKKEKMRLLVQASEQILTDILRSVQSEEVTNIAKRELIKYKRFLVGADMLLDEIVDEITDECIWDIVNQEVDHMNRNQNMLVKYFHMWRETTQRKIEQRNLIQEAPAWALPDTLDEQAWKLAHPRQDETMQMMKRYRLGAAFDFKTVSRTPDEDPINMFSVISRLFRTKQTHRGLLRTRKYFKLLISLPGEREELAGFNSYLTSWLDKNIARDPADRESEEFLCRTQDDLSLCVRTISGVTPRNERNDRVSCECDHADGLLFVMTCRNFLNSRKRLHQLLRLSKIYRRIPVAVIVYNSTVMQEDIESELELENLLDEKVAAFSIFGSSECVRDHNLHSTVIESLQFVAKHSDQASDVEMQRLTGLLTDALGDEMWRRFHESWLVNPSFRKICSIPAFVVNLHNEMVDRVRGLVDEDYEDYPEFPAELRKFVPSWQLDIPQGLEYFPDDWKDPQRAEAIKEFLDGAKLPDMDETLPTELEELQIWLLDYAQQCLPSDQDLADKLGFAAIKCLLERLNQPDLLNLPVMDRLPLISWMSVVKQFAIGMLNFKWAQMQDSLPQEVIYVRENLHQHVTHPWWLECEAVKSVVMAPPDSDDEASSEHTDDQEVDISAIIAKGEAALRKADKKIKKLHDLSMIHPPCEPNPELDTSLYKFEVTAIIRKLEEEPDSPQEKKRVKITPAMEDSLDINSIMSKANSIISRVEKRLHQRFEDDFE